MITTKQQEALEAMAACDNNRAKAAGMLGIDRTSLRDRLKGLQTHAGQINHKVARKMPLGGTYILTTAQNNTPVHSAFLDNLEAYARHAGAQIHVARCTYAKALFANAEHVKGGAKSSDRDGCWYDPRVDQYVSDEPLLLAPTLMWCAELNILPTATRPLSGLDNYAGEASGIFPHTKVAMSSVPTRRNARTRINYTTGALSLRNYVQRKAGQKADFHHVYGALIVEVDLRGRWWVRQLNADKHGNFCDKTLVVEGGVVSQAKSVAAFQPGDVHAKHADNRVLLSLWGPKGAVRKLKPRFQFLHDLHDQAARNHHAAKQPLELFQKFCRGTESVADELATTRSVLDMASSCVDGCETVVVNSNHDRHLERWLDEGDYRKDPINALVFLRLQADRYSAASSGVSWNALQSGLGYPDARFLEVDEDFFVLGIQMGMHGDLGPNGSRGSALSLSRTGQRANLGHSHSTCIVDGIYQAGVCQLDMDYAKGPSSWSVSHIVTYESGKRAILTDWGGKLWR